MKKSKKKSKVPKTGTSMVPITGTSIVRQLDTKKRWMLYKPYKYQTPEELKACFIDYFTTEPEEQWTITGLCLVMGISRQLLCNYQAREDYKPVVEWAKGLVQQSVEASCRRNGRSGDIFLLKNFGFSDHSEQTIHHNFPTELPITFAAMKVVNV